MALVADAREDLRVIYTSTISDAEKRRRKAARLERLAADATAEMKRSGRRQAAWLDGKLNNARLVPMALYQGRLPSFRALLAECERDIRCFYARAEDLSRLDKAAREARLDELAGG